MKLLMKKVLQPILIRIGSMSAALLVAYGMNNEVALQIELAITALLLFLVDLLTESVINRSEK